MEPPAVNIVRTGDFEKGKVIRTMIFADAKSATQFADNFPNNGYMAAEMHQIENIQ